MGSLGGHYIRFGEEQAKDLKAQAMAAARKRREAVSPGLFVAAITQNLRERQEKYESLSKRHKQIRSNFDRAQVGLHKLGSLQVKYQSRLQKIRDSLRSLIKENQGVDYVLDRCKKILEETTITAHLVGEGLKKKFADKHKKAGYQREIALRLDDVDAQFGRCHESLLGEEEAQRRILTDIQQLLADSGKKLPPKMKEDRDRKGRLMEIVLEQQKRLEERRPALKPTRKREDRKREDSKKESKPELAIDTEVEKAFEGLGYLGHEEKSGLLNSTAGKVLLVFGSAVVATAALNLLIK